MRKFTRYAVVTLAVGALSGLAAVPASATAAGPQPSARATVVPMAAVDYTVRVHTGDVESAGTDSDVWVRLNGTLGSSTFLYLDNSADNFERGRIDKFVFTLSNLGRITSVDVRFDRSGDNPGWYLDKLTVAAAGQTRTFPHYGWITWNTTERLPAA
ncbi:MAG TPA: PLAT/LH2 domain-containing protein [Catenuloplanes sp.]|jgi:hypothetical protein